MASKSGSGSSKYKCLACYSQMLCVIQSLTLIQTCSGEIVGTYVLPHGGISLDPTHFNTTNQTAIQEAWAIHDAALGVGQSISHLNPDLIFLSTPHGIADLRQFIFYLNPTGFGVADTDNCQCPPCCYNISIGMDSTVASILIRELKLKLMDVSGLSAFGPPGGASDDFPLKWGEVIPLKFLGNLTHSTKVIILSQPSRRYTDTVEMIPELLDLGSDMYHILSSLGRRVVVIISSDLAHTHDKDGPYGFSKAAKPFDKACGLWASTLDENSLLNIAAKYVDKAKSCGYTGLVMLHGMLQAGGLQNWTPNLYANFHPSYYGMMVASFVLNND
ncbi:protein TTE1956-like [Amphiura filiformis]|uniref:protein TTE1956-like n=1 Tax=Amphiura filiformis TaxID=82378 RepID=UPI003B20CAE5